jgi:hypothetical protein
MAYVQTMRVLSQRRLEHGSCYVFCLGTSMFALGSIITTFLLFHSFVQREVFMEQSDVVIR